MLQPPSVQLCRYETADIDSLYEAVDESRAELGRWMAWCGAEYDRATAACWVESRAAAWESNEEWGFLIKGPDGTLLGTCGLHRIFLAQGLAEVGYWVRSSATGRGVATAALQQLSAWAFREQKLRRLELIAAVENTASQRVAVKAGYEQEGLLRQRFVVRGTAQNAYLYALLDPSDA